MSDDQTCTPVWSVYLVRCEDGSLYTGIATDVDRRLAEHELGRGKGARYLRGKGPLRLVCQRVIGEMGLALKVEGRIKKLPKACKENLLICDAALDAIVAEVRGSRDDGER